MIRTEPGHVGWRLLLVSALMLLAACEPRQPTGTAMPSASAEPTVLGHRDGSANGEPSCTFTVRYAGATDQSTVWSGEPCSAVTGLIVDTGKLEELGKLARLDTKVREDVAREGGKVFYAEGAFAAAIYPLGGAGKVYKVYISD